MFGPERSGRTTTLATIVGNLNSLGIPVRKFLAAPRRTELLNLAEWERVGRGTDGCDELLVELAAEVRERGEGQGDVIVIVVDDGEELSEGASASALGGDHSSRSGLRCGVSGGDYGERKAIAVLVDGYPISNALVTPCFSFPKLM